MRISSSQLYSQGLNAILNQQADLARTQLEVATGKRIFAPSDDPAGAKRILDLNEALSLTRQFQSNADAAVSRLGTEDGVLSSVTNILQRVRELAILGNNVTVDPANRASLAVEVRERLGEMLGLANATDGKGEHLFGGFSSRTKPFVADGAGGFTYNGDQGARRVQIAPEVRVGDGHSGTEVFQSILNGNGTFATREGTLNAGSGVIDPGTVIDLGAWVPDTYTITFTTAADFEVRDGAAGLVTSGTYTSGGAISFNGVQTFITGTPVPGDTFTLAESVNQDIFTTVQNLALAFEGGMSSSQLNNAVNRFLTDVDRSLDNVVQVRAQIGARINVIDSEREVNADLELLMRQDLSRVEDADLAQVVTLLNRRLVALEAAQQSFVRVQNLSLFNFI